jgi:hypothetical protein
MLIVQKSKTVSRQFYKMWHSGISDPYFFGNDESGIMNALTFLQTYPSNTALNIKYHSEKLANIIWRKYNSVLECFYCKREIRLFVFVH